MSKSHVQIPASLLKPISINKNTYKVYVMNADGLITEESIKKCNTIENYYSDYVESEILANLESQFGEVKNKIIVAVKESCNIYLSDKELETLKRFVMITFARNPWFAKQLRKSQIFDFGLSIEDYSIVATNSSYHVFEEHFKRY